MKISNPISKKTYDFAEHVCTDLVVYGEGAKFQATFSRSSIKALTGMFENGYCSFCFIRTEHTLIQKNYLRRNIYTCSGCGGKTVQCRFCYNFSKCGDYWDDELCAEHDGCIADFSTLNIKINNIEEYKPLFARNSVNVKKLATVTAASIGGAAVIAPVAFLAAPAVGGAVGSLMGLSGAAATNAGLAAIGGGAIASGGLGMVGGVAITSAIGAGLGGSMGGVISNSYFGDIEGFDILKIKEGTGMPVLFIDGFLSQENCDTEDWQAQLKEIYPENPWYYVTWESKRLLDIGKSLINIGGQHAVKAFIGALAKKASKAAVKKAGPLGQIYSVFGLVNNPWSIACTKAGQTGVLLADILARTDKKYILCGHSLGARVIYYALEALGTKEEKLVYDVHLLGGAVGNDKEHWEKAQKAVSGKIINYKSTNDLVLSTMYRFGTFFKSKPIGLNDIEIAGIETTDVKSVVEGHMAYKNNFVKIAILSDMKSRVFR